jgi:hypothetical protein
MLEFVKKQSLQHGPGWILQVGKISENRKSAEPQPKPEAHRGGKTKTTTKEHCVAEPPTKPFTTEATEEHGVNQSQKLTAEAQRFPCPLLSSVASSVASVVALVWLRLCCGVSSVVNWLIGLFVFVIECNLGLFIQHQWSHKTE